MSCDTRDEEVRIIMKYSTIAGTEPTIPTSGDHSDGTWLPTDLYTGELFLNSVDDKLWIRTDNGIVGIGGTAGATFSGIYDYVHIAGGTYSGEVYAPTFSSIGIVAQNIYGDQFEGNAGASASFIGTFFGDGSGLTGLICEWLGGTVSAPVHFTDRVDFTNDTYLDGTIYSNNPNIVINSSLEISGGVSASIFYGDGSGLTNLPTGTYSDTYTSTAALTGNTILFTRNDASDYSVDLTPILATQGVAMIQWDDTTDVLSLYMNDSSQLGITIDTFAQVNSTGPITAPEFYGGTFYGSFVGDITGVIGATGPAGATGAPGPIGATGVAGTLEQTLKAGNTTGTQSIYISSSASVIRGYNGVHHHWYDATNPLGDYYRIENGTGASSSFIQLNDDTSGRILIQNNNAFDNTSSESSYARINIGVDAIQNSTYYKDNVSGTTWYGSTHDTTASGTDAITRDYILDTTAWVSTSMTGVYLQGARNGGLSASEITITSDAITSRTENDGYSWTQIEQKTDVIIVSGSASHFRGLEYAEDYSATFTNRSLVDKSYIDTNLNATDITYVALEAAAYAGTLTKGTTYFITDRKIWIKALDTNLLSTSAQRSQQIIKDEAYQMTGTLGVWNSDLAPSIGDKTIFNCELWSNTTGANTSPPDTLDDWALITTDALYYDKIFDIEYVIKYDSINVQSDDRGNILRRSISSDLLCDWGNTNIFDNDCAAIYNNSNAFIAGNRITGAIYNNQSGSGVQNNFGNIEIHSNICGAITGNRCSISGNIADNLSNNDCLGSITNNNIGGGSIQYNGNNGGIYNNTTIGDISYNTNTSDIFSNANTGDIVNNSNAGPIESNTCLAITNNSNSATNGAGIVSNSNNGNIIYNSNGGYISLNTNLVGVIEQNSNNGNITANTITGSIFKNSNNGDINNNATTGWIRYNNNLGDISWNTNSDDIENNMNNGNISSNDNGSKIGFNLNNGAIILNTGAGYISSNLNNGAIAQNSNNGIVFLNSNGGGIFSNSNNGSISLNTNGTDIGYNSINGYIQNNNNSGSIQNNTQASGTTNITYNNNNGNISAGARTANITGTIVNI